MDKETFLKKARERLETSRGHCGDWRQTARKEYAFVAGDQWEEHDLDSLREQNRPAVVFNYSEKMIDAVNGAEVSNRQEVTYKGRTLDGAPLAEMLTNAGKWVRQETSGEDEETDAFRDTLISGMGWVGTTMDYSENADGMPIMDRIDPIEMEWDPASSKPGLIDRRWDAWGIWMDNSLIKVRWGNKMSTDGQGWENDAGGLFHIQQGNRYREDAGNDFDDERRVDQTKVWNYQCVENEPYYRVSNGQGGIQEVEAGEFKKIKKQIVAAQLQYVKLWKKVYYRGFLADEEMMTCLEWGKSPCQVGFTRQCITGKRDRNKNQWYGLTRVMMDPQRWANKWLSQIMYIINSNAKGGLLAEIDAFQDPDAAQNDWSSPDKVIFLKQGGIDKIKEKSMAAYPSGLAQLMEFALSSLPQVTGINLEALGLANRDQANVLEQSRKQAAFGLLAPIFDSLRRYRKNQGKILLFFIRTFISDNRLIRVVGPGFEQYVPLLKVPDEIDFDIVVDQSPTAPDVKQQTWETLMQLVPAMIKAGMPVPPDLIKYAPLPSALIAEWQSFNQQKQQSQISPQQIQQLQQQLQQLTQENQQLKTAHDDKMAMAQAKTQEMAMKMQMEKEKQDFEMQLQAQKAQFEMELETQQAAGKMQLQMSQQDNANSLQQQQAEHSMGLAKQSNDGNLKIKAAAAGLDPASKDVTMKIDTTDMADALKSVAEEFAGTMKEIVAVMNGPKVVVRDSKGVITGVKPAGKTK